MGSSGKSSSSGTSLTVKDEGGALATAADTLDFVGAGVTASGTGSTKTITIPGGASVPFDATGQATAATVIAKGSVTGDTNDRIEVRADGTIDLGPGNAALDLHLSRSANNTLQVNNDRAGATNVALVLAVAGTGQGKIAGLTSGSLQIFNKTGATSAGLVAISDGQVTLGDNNGNTFVTANAAGVALGKATALATNATAGFTYLPQTAGTPTGTPTGGVANTTPVVIDTTGSKLWAYIGGAWKSVALT